MKDLKTFLRKKKKQRYGCEQYKNLPEDEKQKLVEYQKNTIEWEKIPYSNHKKLLFLKIITLKVLLLKNKSMFQKINFEAISLFQKANLNENLF